MQKIIDKYFEECKKDKLIPTLAGCAYALNMSRMSFYNYEKKDEFIYTIKKARDYVISLWESKLVNANGNAGGIIFASKNYGYADRQEISHSGGVKIIKDDIQ